MKAVEERFVTDSDLHQALLDGSTEAVDYIVDKYLNKLFYFCNRHLHNNQDAEDVVWDTFVKLWESPEKWVPQKGSLSTWLFTVALNKSRDIGRRRERTSGVKESIQTVHEMNEEANLTMIEGGSFNGAVSSDSLNKALNKLSVEHRSLLALMYGCGMSSKEVAEVMDISVSACNSLAARSRRSLRSQLALEVTS